jgi:hypothetical protein
VRLKDHGVSAGYIKRMKERGYADLSLDEYIVSGTAASASSRVCASDSFTDSPIGVICDVSAQQHCFY